MQRKIIKIDEDKCTGCGLCIPNCKEGALQIIDGKARLVNDQFCDGLGACLGHCPEGAITIEEREAQPFSEEKVKENMDKLPCGCPGTAVQDFSQDEGCAQEGAGAEQASTLRQWPVQLRLVPPGAPYFRERDVILCADCVAYALGNFHAKYLKGKSIAIACPKLDQDLERYTQKITALIDEANINTLTVMIMEVPCCAGLLQVAKAGATQAKRKIPIKLMVVGIKGDIIKEEWV